MKILRIITMFLALSTSVNAQVSENTNVSVMKDILSRHFVQFNNKDIQPLAEYYAKFPEVVELFRKIDGFPWKIFSGKTFETRAQISGFSVESAMVVYTHGVGFRIRRHKRCKKEAELCSISTADVLLHEILHVKSMFLNTSAYLKSRMGSLIQYENPHETGVISAERRLARAMSSRDKKPRPLRRSHSGARPITTPCITCVKYVK